MMKTDYELSFFLQAVGIEYGMILWEHDGRMSCIVVFGTGQMMLGGDITSFLIL